MTMYYNISGSMFYSKSTDLLYIFERKTCSNNSDINIHIKIWKWFQSLKKNLFLPLLCPKTSIILVISSFKTLFTYSLSICNNAKLDSLSCPMEFLKYVFSLLKDENERSAEHEVAGITARIFKALADSGNILNAPTEWSR